MCNPYDRGQIYVQMFPDSSSEIYIFDTGLEFARIMLLFWDSAPSFKVASSMKAQQAARLVKDVKLLWVTNPYNL